MLTVFFWKKAWTWLKHYWHWPVILVLLAVSIFSGRSARKKLFKLLDKQKESYEKEIQVVKETSEEASKKKSKISEEYVEKIKEIEKEHDVKVEDLKEEKKKELELIIEEKKDKPEELAREIAKIFNVNYHEK